MNFSDHFRFTPFELLGQIISWRLPAVKKWQLLSSRSRISGKVSEQLSNKQIRIARLNQEWILERDLKGHFWGQNFLQACGNYSRYRQKYTKPISEIVNWLCLQVCISKFQAGLRKSYLERPRYPLRIIIYFNRRLIYWECKVHRKKYPVLRLITL